MGTSGRGALGLGNVRSAGIQSGSNPATSRPTALSADSELGNTYLGVGPVRRAGSIVLNGGTIYGAVVANPARFYQRLRSR